MAENIMLIIVSAILVEALVEYVKQVLDTPTLVATIVIGVIIAFIFNATLFNNLGFEINVMVDKVLTGIIISRGSNYVYDLVGKLTGY